MLKNTDKIAKDSFDVAFDRLFDHEGGFQDDPKDRGNWTEGVVGLGELRGTKFGISAMTYPELDIVNLTQDGAKRIYFRDWWMPMKMRALPKPIHYQLFDAAVNHGMGSATKMLQRAVGSVSDGIIGPKTVAAIHSMDHNDLLMRFLAERLVFMTKVPTWMYYSKGWSRRIAQNLRYASIDN